MTAPPWSTRLSTSRPGAALLTVVAALLAVLTAGLAHPTPAAAHDLTSTAYVEVRGAGTRVQADLDLEYDLLMKSAWLYAEAYEAKGRTAQLHQLKSNADAVTEYVTARFALTHDDRPCTPRLARDADVRTRGTKPFAVLTLAYNCPGTGGTYAISSALFPDAESFVHSTRTIVHYDLDGRRGSQVLTAGEPTVETGGHHESHQIVEFFLLGTEHLLFGLDHILFLLSLLIGARTLRAVLLTATAFTAAHSVTFLLAATGVVHVPAAVVEPVIAASIAVVALAGILLRDREGSGRWRLPTVFLFGLVHGLGFAGALGIDESWSWELLLSLLSFNVGIEAVQLGIIAVVFPLLLLLRRTTVHRWVLPALTTPIVVVSLYWFWDRVSFGGALFDS
ncbi:HupE/UreJ family protein [Streptomyces pseudovenezuelae]|uniref:Hydrogenase/urease accessory protein HupE n=1 Tax=Streptomyces pseudovenezuelae TaxID=67350 RepID=A0ABT6LVL6_9ACTN|nr:HupE/UreJ family protein [Streptomyces pseudovenezuelae]MDH6220357.1 hydrogenase/urease accessory protein HupE [Streptomyces pseudovenezuelae]